MLKLSPMCTGNFCWNPKGKQQTTNAKTRLRIIGLTHFSLARNLLQKKYMRKKIRESLRCFLLSRKRDFLDWCLLIFLKKTPNLIWIFHTFGKNALTMISRLRYYQSKGGPKSFLTIEFGLFHFSTDTRGQQAFRLLPQQKIKGE